MDSLMMREGKQGLDSRHSKGSTGQSAWVGRVAWLILEEKRFFFREAFKLVATAVLLACSHEVCAVGFFDEVLERRDGRAMLLAVGAEKINVEVDDKLSAGLKTLKFFRERGPEVLCGVGESCDHFASFREPVRENDGSNDSGDANDSGNDWEVWFECLYFVLYPTVALWLAGGLSGGGRGHEDEKPNV